MRQTTGTPNISCETDLGELLPAVNHEGKAVVLGGMEWGKAYGKTALHRDLFLKPQGEPPAYSGTLGTSLEYCMLTFEPAGVVSRVPAATTQYELTDLGNYEGKALAGHVLALSLDAGDISLRSLYGMNGTDKGKDSQPSIDRLRIFRMLLDSSDVQASDVQAGLGINALTATRNLQWLDEDGIIEYCAVDGRDISDHIIYGLPERFTGDDRSGMRQLVRDALQGMVAKGTREFSQAGLMEVLEEQYPKEGFEKPNRRKYAQRIVNELAANGHITKGPFGGKRKSSVAVRDRARPVIQQAVAIAEGMLSGDGAFMKEGRENLRYILEDEASVRTLITKAFKASPSANGIGRQQRFDYVTAALKEQDAPSGELVSRLKIHGMTRISTKRTLEAMRDEGIVISVPIPDSWELSWQLVPEDAG